MDALDRPTQPLDVPPLDTPVHWPDVRLLLQGLRARAARDPHPVTQARLLIEGLPVPAEPLPVTNPRGTGGEIRWT